MSTEFSPVQQAGASAPAVSVPQGQAGARPVVRDRPGAELALALAASEVISDEPVLEAERLRVYHVALELQCLANILVPSVNRVIRDQFERASLSIILNLAEAMCSQCLQRIKTF